MLSLIVGCCQGPQTAYNTANRVAAAIDTAGFITMVVLGVLAILGTANIPLGGSLNSYMFTAAGVIGLIILAIKNIKSVDGRPVDKVVQRNDAILITH